jgi:hypothetical protein
LSELAWIDVLFLERFAGQAGVVFPVPAKAAPGREHLFRMLVVASLITSLLCRLVGRVVSTDRTSLKYELGGRNPDGPGSRRPVSVLTGMVSKKFGQNSA